MVEVNSFEEAYEYLEKNALNHRHVFALGRIFEQLIEKYQNEKDIENEKKAHNEREVFFFRIVDSEIEPMTTYSDKEGNPFNYPDLTKYDVSSLDYIEKRLNESENPLLKARYATVLWNSTRKHGKYAEIALNAFIELTDIYSKLDRDNPDKNYGLEVIDSLKNAYIIARKIRLDNKIDELTNKIVDTVKNYDWNSKNSFVIRISLLEFMLDSKFDDEKFESMISICEKLSDKLDGNQKIMVYDVARKIDLKLQKDEKKWIRKIAEENEKMMNSSIDNNALVADHFWEKAFENYQKIGDQQKIEELMKKRETIKKNSKLKEIKTSVNMEGIDKVTNQISDKISKMSEIDIIKTLIIDEGLIPDVITIKEQSKDILKEHPLIGLFPIVTYDEQGNVSQKFATDDEIAYHQFLSHYRLSMEMFYKILLDRIMYKIIKNGNLTADGLLEFFQKNTWYGVTLYKTFASGDKIPYTWVNMIAPSIRSYFNESTLFTNENPLASFMLSIDSLSQKIEGIIRDMHQLTGIPTAYPKRVGRTQIIREKDLNTLLAENKIPHFTEDEIMYFKFILTEQSGYNIRNRVAHSLILPAEYTFSIANKCLLVLLKIAKFQITPIEVQEN